MDIIRSVKIHSKIKNNVWGISSLHVLAYHGSDKNIYIQQREDHES